MRRRLHDPSRLTSLRARWNWAFARLTAVIVIAGLASLLGTDLLVQTFRDASVRTETAATTSTKLRAGVVAHAIAVSAAATGAQQQEVEALRSQVLADFKRGIANEGAGRAASLLDRALEEWRAVVRIVGRSGQSGDVETRGAALTTRDPKVLSLLDRASSASRADARADAARSARLFLEVLVALAALELFAVVLAVRLARHLSHEVLRPVGTLRDAANRLAAGELDHRVVVDRADELGELAVAFNAMAGSIAASQLSLSREAKTDSLSGLANRAAFDARLEVALAQSDGLGGVKVVLFVDLDDFKDVNDTLGHAAGDNLLRVVADRLTSVVRPRDLVARLGGDEFAMLLDGVSDLDAAFAVAERVVSILDEPIEIGTSRMRVGASVGMALARDSSTIDELMREADVAMYTAKAKGKHRVERYDGTLDELAVARQSLRHEVCGAADRGELVVEYQPVVDLEHGTLAGLEALVRWQHPIRGLLPPSMFIDLAEETGAIVGIGDWVLATATREVQRWRSRYGLPALFISVNVSVRQMDAPGFAEHVMAVLAATRLDPTNLVIEITESILADPDGGGAAALGALRARGVRVALDDFGTGYSSIGYLRQLPLDILKIDRSFMPVANVPGPDDVLLEAIVNMAHHLGLTVIPEGIEDTDQLSSLRAMGCTLGQGFLFSRPVPPDAIELLLVGPTSFPHVVLSDAVRQRSLHVVR